MSFSLGVDTRILGCLLGSAIGDALGMPFEGASPGSISERWDSRSFLPSGFLSTLGLRAGQYIDDTQLLLATAESVISARGFDPRICAEFYLQSYARGIRGIGGSTRESLQRLKAGVSWRFSGTRGREAAGNGVAMRIAPIGLYHGVTRLPGLARNVKKCGAITHRNSIAIEGARIVARAVEAIMSGMDKGQLLRILSPRILSPFGHAFGRVNTLLRSSPSVTEVASVLGTSGYVLHSVPMSLYCFFAHDNFSDCVINAVLAGGDTDTNASIAGALAGCYYGSGAIPDEWVSKVEGLKHIKEIAIGLSAFQRA